MNYDLLNKAILTRFIKLGYTEREAKISLLEIWREWDRLKEQMAIETFEMEAQAEKDKENNQKYV